MAFCVWSTSARPCYNIYNTAAPAARRLKGPTAAPSSTLRGPATPTRKSKMRSIRRVGWNTWQDSPHHWPKALLAIPRQDTKQGMQARRQEQSSYSRAHHTHAHHAPTARQGPPPPNGTRSHSPQAAQVTCQSNVPLASG